MKTKTWYALLCEYANPARPRDIYTEDQVTIVRDDKMAEVARQLADDSEVTREQAVRVLREAAERRGVLDNVHIIGPGTRRTTNREIIDAIERAPE